MIVNRYSTLMITRHILWAFSLFFIFPVYAQRSHQYTIEFEKDRHAISDFQRNEMESFVDSLPNERILSVTISGHTDSDGSDDYNIRLSQRRAETALGYLRRCGIPDSLLSINYHGESQPIQSNETDEGMQKNRRVSIAFSIARKPPGIPCGGMRKLPCDVDTMITLPNGTMYKINKCLYERNPHCVTIREFMNADQVAEEDLLTMTSEGERLISGGMLKYDICDSIEVEAYVPVRTNCDGEDMKLWNINDDGTWEQVSSDRIPPVTFNNRRYYPITLRGIGSLNLDKLPPIRLPGPPPPKTRFKAKWRSNILLKSVTIYCDCPLTAMRIMAKNSRERRVVMNRLCCDSTMIMIDATTKDGKPLTFKYKPLSELKEGSSLGECRTSVRRKWWFFRTWNKQMYRKYKISRKDFE